MQKCIGDVGNSTNSPLPYVIEIKYNRIINFIAQE